MNTPDAALVQRITEAVLAAMQARAQIKPPIGICTGDYSQFPELAQRNAGAVAPSPSVVTTPAAPTPAPARAALTGVITAATLQQAMDHAPDGVALISEDARLTPMAHDVLRACGDRVKRVPAGGTTTRGLGAWVWWIDGSCPVALRLADTHGRRLRPCSEPREAASLATVVHKFALNVGKGDLAGGVLYTKTPALAAALCNRHTSLRAVVCRRVEDLDAAAADLAPNVVVIHYPSTPGEAMTAIVERALRGMPEPSAVVQRQLEGRR